MRLEITLKVKVGLFNIGVQGAIAPPSGNLFKNSNLIVIIAGISVH